MATRTIGISSDSSVITIVVTDRNRTERLDVDSLVDQLKSRFGGEMSSGKRVKGRVRFIWTHADSETVLRELETGGLHEIVRSVGRAEIVEILLGKECVYEAVPRLTNVKLPPIKDVNTEELERAMESVDVLLLTVTDIERETLQGAMEPWPGGTQILQGALGNRTYRLGIFGCYHAAHTSSTMGALGRQGAAVTAGSAIRETRPKAVLLLGIAFGVDRSKQRLGDVIVAESVFPYELQRKSSNTSIKRGTEMQCGLMLSNRFRYMRDDWSMQGGTREVKVLQGLMLSGEKLVDDKTFRDDLVKGFPTALGGEMEAAGAYSAAAEEKVEMILVKAICDWADGHKNDDAQPFAARTAVSLAKHVLSKPDVLKELGAVPISQKHLAGPSSIPRKNVATAQIIGHTNPISDWTLPPENINFVGRHEQLANLHDRFIKANGSRQAVTGLGGIGKTTLAVAYAYRFADKYNHICFCSADSLDSLHIGYRNLAKQLSLQEASSLNTNVTVQAVQRWLQNVHSDNENIFPYLLILDNADFGTEKNKLVSMIGKSFLPKRTAGHILVTCRNPTLHEQLGFSRKSTLPLGVFDEKEALEYFDLWVNDTESWKTAEDKQAALDLADALGFLPLAMEHAAGYLRNEGMGSFKEYFELFHELLNQSDKEALEYLLDQSIEEDREYHDSVASETGRHEKTVLTTWRINFDILANKSQASADFFILCSFLGPDQLPVNQLVDAAKYHVPSIQALFLEQDKPRVQREKTKRLISAIAEASLGKVDDGIYSLSLHRMVQLSMRANLRSDGRKKWIEVVTAVANQVFPKVEANFWPIPSSETLSLCEHLVPHIQALCQRLESAEFQQAWDRNAASVMSKAGIYLYVRGSYGQAEPMLRLRLKIYRKLFPDDTSGIISALTDLAAICKDLELKVEAQKYHQEALDLCRLHLPASSALQKELSNFALYYISQKSQGDFRAAKKLLDEAEHMVTEHQENTTNTFASVVNNLGFWYGEQAAITHDPAMRQDLYRQSIPYYQRAYDLRNEIFNGVDHPDALTSLANLGWSYYHIGETEQGEDIIRDVVERRRNLFTFPHPSLAESLNNLAFILIKENKEDANLENILREAMQIFASCYGQNSTNTATSKFHLARLLYNKSELEEARRLAKETVSTFEELHDPRLPDVVERLGMLLS